MELIVFNVGESELFFARRVFLVREVISISMSSLVFNFMFRLILFDKILRNLGQFIWLKLGLLGVWVLIFNRTRVWSEAGSFRLVV